MKIDGIDSVTFNMDEAKVMGASGKNVLVQILNENVEAVKLLRSRMQRAAGMAKTPSASEAMRFAVQFAAFFACKGPYADDYRTVVERRKKRPRVKKNKTRVESESATVDGASNEASE